MRVRINCSSSWCKEAAPPMSRATSSKASWMIDSIWFEELTFVLLRCLSVCAYPWPGQAPTVRGSSGLESAPAPIHSPVAFHRPACLREGFFEPHGVTAWREIFYGCGYFEKKMMGRVAGSVIFYRGS